jgi:hypothetical protein
MPDQQKTLAVALTDSGVAIKQTPHSACLSHIWACDMADAAICMYQMKTPTAMS